MLLDLNGHVITSDVVKEIDWLPKTYQVVVDSTTLARDKSLEYLSSMLKNECLLGNVVRQELVSMIPALLLDVKASHSVIDPFGHRIFPRLVIHLLFRWIDHRHVCSTRK